MPAARRLVVMVKVQVEGEGATVLFFMERAGIIMPIANSVPEKDVSPTWDTRIQRNVRHQRYNDAASKIFVTTNYLTDIFFNTLRFIQNTNTIVSLQL